MAEKPQGRDDADVPSPERRGAFALIGVLGAAITAMIGIPILEVLSNSITKKRPAAQWIPLGDVADWTEADHKETEYSYHYKDTWLPTVGRSRVVISGKGDGDLQVLSTVCTHLGCGVHWDVGRQQFLCPCHGGVYDADGNVVAGPPPRPLKRYETRVDGGILQVHEDFEA